MATQKSTLDAAVRAGGQYARFDPTDTASIISRVNSYTAFSPALTSAGLGPASIAILSPESLPDECLAPA